MSDSDDIKQKTVIPHPSKPQSATAQPSTRKREMPRMIRQIFTAVFGVVALMYGLKLLGTIFDLRLLKDWEHDLLKLALWWLP